MSGVNLIRENTENVIIRVIETGLSEHRKQQNLGGGDECLCFW